MDEREPLLARLNLRAVLPALAGLFEVDEGMGITTARWAFDIRLASGSGLSTTLRFDRGNLQVDPIGSPRRRLQLLYFSHARVNRAFAGNGLVVPLPWGNVGALFRLPALTRCLGQLSTLLRCPRNELVERGLEGDRVTLLLGYVVPAAVVVLAGHEAQSRHRLAPYSSFVAQIAIGDRRLSWIERDGETMRWGRGAASASPNVVLRFRDDRIALDALDRRVDPLAAAATGEIRAQGMIPLGDALGWVMDRVARYLN